MRLHIAFLASSVACLAGCADIIQAGLFTPGPVRGHPNPFANVSHGLLAGSAIGLSSTYLWARRDGWQSENDGRTMAYGFLVGALAGGTAGLVSGIADVVADEPGRGYLVLRDTNGGAFLGATMGLLTGVLIADRQGRSEPIAIGTAVGTLAGAGLGLTLGIFEASRAAPTSTATRRTRPWTVAFAPVAGSGEVAPGFAATLSGRF